MCGLEKNQTMSNELAKLVLEQCAQESYRVATGNIHEMTAAKESHSTFRRWVLKTEADEIRIPEGTMGAVPGVLYADGTKCKSISADGHSCKGDVKVLLGVRNEGTVFPIGTWTGHETWQNISDQLAKRQVKFPDKSSAHGGIHPVALVVENLHGCDVAVRIGIHEKNRPVARRDDMAAVGRPGRILPGSGLGDGARRGSTAVRSRSHDAPLSGLKR